MPYGPKRIGESQAGEIRRLYETGRYTQKQLGAMFGVSQPLVCKIVNNAAHRPKAVIGGEAAVRVGFNHGN